MKRLVWCSDIHLDHLVRYDVVGASFDEDAVKAFCDQVNICVPDVVLITGDISQSPYVVQHLKWLRKHVLPIADIAFVLGNHDYYFGSFKYTENAVNKLLDSEPTMYWLSVEDEPYQLTDHKYLIGHDGWYDGLYADWFAQPKLGMQDYFLIRDFQQKPEQIIFDLMQQRAKLYTKHISGMVTKILQQDKETKEIYIATHIPPFPRNSVHNGKVSDPMWLPCFSSKKAGDLLCNLSEVYPNIKFISLCGHSHGASEFIVDKNLVSLGADAEYGIPKVYKTLEIE